MTSVNQNICSSFSCGIDKYLLQTPTYSENVMSAFVEVHVFKFADKANLYFQCQISLCVDIKPNDTTADPCPGYVRPSKFCSKFFLANFSDYFSLRSVLRFVEDVLVFPPTALVFTIQFPRDFWM